MRVAIDENVIAVANDVGRISSGQEAVCPQADDACRMACISFLAQAIRSGQILLDEEDRVFGFYRRKATLAGQPGSGDAFLKALFQISYDPTRVIRVALPPAPTFGLPNAFVTSGFDSDDFIYVALARSQEGSEVVNAVDSDYSQHKLDLDALPVTVREVCPECIKTAP